MIIYLLKRNFVCWNYYFSHILAVLSPPSPPDFLIVDVFSKQLISPVRWGADTADTQLHVTLSQQRPKTLFAGYSERFALTWRYSGRHIYLYLFFIVLSAIFSSFLLVYYGAVPHSQVDYNKLVVVIMVNFGDVSHYLYLFVIKYLIIETIFFICIDIWVFCK